MTVVTLVTTLKSHFINSPQQHHDKYALRSMDTGGEAESLGAGC
jgi:hypothetical protein